ncbi:LysR family transcriptional regulator [Oceanobacter mangrovi]|uniref:LysR family transcriptional regulator n=1 Tax=Oceanobacter mangrovi TaxID=2862510 RepID=UPI001C8D7064|nr:LysR family transcriptional regulator [Oceanobacter mangrovi]
MAMDEFSWDDLHIAYRVAEAGTLSAAAERLGLNHSTLLRRISRLEQQLGTRLFIRHQRGYQLTDAGQLMLERMQPVADEMVRLFNGLSTYESTPSGTLRISTVSDFSLFFAPLLHAFREAYPQIRVHVVATDERTSLASGDVHAAIRMGEQPTEPDLIARKLMPSPMDLFAAQSYVERYGLLRNMADVNRHFWVLPSGRKRQIPGIRELVDRIDPSRIVFESNSFTDIFSAVSEGMGVGPVGFLQRASSINQDLVQIDLGLPTPQAFMWFVYHKDMRGSSRIRALQNFMIEHLPGKLAGLTR